jgi:hypothetical protein
MVSFKQSAEQLLNQGGVCKIPEARKRRILRRLAQLMEVSNLKQVKISTVKD